MSYTQKIEINQNKNEKKTHCAAWNNRTYHASIYNLNSILYTRLHGCYNSKIIYTGDTKYTETMLSC